MLRILSSFNDDEDNYFRVSVDDARSEEFIKTLISFLDSLGITDHLEAEPEILSERYEDWIGRHEFFRTDDYIIHLIFSTDCLHMVVTCGRDARDRFMGSFNKLFSL